MDMNYSLFKCFVPYNRFFKRGRKGFIEILSNVFLYKNILSVGGISMKEQLFSDLEGLRIGIAIEEYGRNFYQQAYELAQKQEQKKLFLMLKGEEVLHLETFTKLYEELKTKKEAGSDEYLFDVEASRYLTVLAEGHIFPIGKQAEVTLSKAITVEEILNMAIQAEKDSILFYDELAKQSKFDVAKQVFLRLKEEEQGHVVKLRNYLYEWTREVKF